jgi:hypothetical protein
MHKKLLHSFILDRDSLFGHSDAAAGARAYQVTVIAELGRDMHQRRLLNVNRAKIQILLCWAACRQGSQNAALSQQDAGLCLCLPCARFKM